MGKLRLAHGTRPCQINELISTALPISPPRNPGSLFNIRDYVHRNSQIIKQEVMVMLNKFRHPVTLMTLLTLILAFPAGGSARLIEGVYFTPRIVASEVPMVLNGVGLKTLWKVVKVSVAALYLGEGVAPSAVLSDVPKRLEIEYFHAISGGDFAKLTAKLLEKNVDTATLRSLRPRIDRFNSLYVDVKPGDRYSMTYVPGKGTILALNGVEIGGIEGEDFAAAVFAMWLGQQPLSDSLKRELLGQG